MLLLGADIWVKDDPPKNKEYKVGHCIGIVPFSLDPSYNKKGHFLFYFPTYPPYRNKDISEKIAFQVHF